MSSKNGLLFIYTETPLHVGCGEGLGAIDLPLQRERMSSLPVVPGSGIKGALREVFRRSKDPNEIDLFGPPPPEKNADSTSASTTRTGSSAPEHAGALTITDAKLLLLPIRTVYGGWAWATSPMILERLAREHHIAGRGEASWAKSLTDLARKLSPSPEGNPKALVFKKTPAIAPENHLILEDTLYDPIEDTAFTAPLLKFFEQAFPTCTTYDPLKTRLADQLVVLDDTELKHWAKYGTEIVTRVRIDNDTGTVADGALWTEESLPAESLLWATTIVHNSRRPKPSTTCDALMDALTKKLKENSRIFLGGDRTIGRGLCGINLLLGGQ